MTAPIIISDAILSEDSEQAYRYLLTRIWDHTGPIMVWVMLNPSTADHEINDPTILACIDFARRNGCGGIMVVNMFALRSPHPKVMMAAADPVGPHNDTYLKAAFLAAKINGHVIAAWGTNGSYRGRDAEIVAMVEAYGLTMECFGVTKDGHPKHPLARGHHRIPRDTKPVPYRRAA